MKFRNNKPKKVFQIVIVVLVVVACVGVLAGLFGGGSSSGSSSGTSSSTSSSSTSSGTNSGTSTGGATQQTTNISDSGTTSGGATNLNGGTGTGTTTDDNTGTTTGGSSSGGTTTTVNAALSGKSIYTNTFISSSLVQSSASVTSPYATTYGLSSVSLGSCYTNGFSANSWGFSGQSTETYVSSLFYHYEYYNIEYYIELGSNNYSDIIFIDPMYGDYQHNVSLGGVNDTTSMQYAFKHFYWYLSNLEDKGAKVPLVVITTTPDMLAYTGVNSIGRSLSDYRTTLLALCEEYDFPILDLYTLYGTYSENTTGSTVYIDTTSQCFTLSGYQKYLDIIATNLFPLYTTSLASEIYQSSDTLQSIFIYDADNNTIVIDGLDDDSSDNVSSDNDSSDDDSSDDDSSDDDSSDDDSDDENTGGATQTPTTVNYSYLPEDRLLEFLTV